MRHDPPSLGEFEQMVLLAVLQCGENAYGVTVQDELTRRTQRRVASGAIYMTLDRLEQKGLLVSSLTEPLPERGGRPRRCYKATKPAIAALKHSRRALVKLWEGLAIVEDSMTTRCTSASVIAAVLLIAFGALSHAQGINKRGFLTKGEAVPILKGYGIDGKVITIDYRTQGKPTVVYVVSVADGDTGGFVKTNEANFAAIVRQAGERFRFVLLVPQDRGGLLTYVAKAKSAWGTTPVTVVANVSEDLKQDMCLFSYPQTLAISTDAHVLESFQGSYTEQSWNAQPAVIERFFGVKLPAAKDR